MSEYLTPGVYVEEVSFRPRSIEGLGTSTTAFVGPTRTGPVGGAPELLTSYTDFARIYGDLDDFDYGNDARLNRNYVAHAVRAYFNNGGSRLYVVRIFTAEDDSDGIADSRDVPVIKDADTKTVRVCFAARFPGKLPPKAQVVAIQKAAPVGGDSFKKAAEGSVARVHPGAEWQLDGDTWKVRKRDGTLGDAVADTGAAESIWLLVEGTDGDPKALATPKVIDKLDDLLNGSRVRVFEATEVWVKEKDGWERIIQGGDEVTGDGSKVNDADIAAVVDAYLLTLDVEYRPTPTETTRFEALSPVAGHPRDIRTVLAEKPNRRADQLSNPIALRIEKDYTAGTAALLTGLVGPQPAGTAVRDYKEPHLEFALAGGDDGALPSSGDYEDGFGILAGIEDVSIVAAPGYSARSETDRQSIQLALLAHVDKTRLYRIGVLDSPPDQTPSGMRDLRGLVDSNHAALYYPWVVVANPLAGPNSNQPAEIELPPSGFVCGIYARNDVNRGVHKAPANEVVQGALRFERNVNFGEQELLNPIGVNCLRFLSGRGMRVWGARTISSDSEWKYVNVRRYFNYLGASVDRGSQWVVFEPNGEMLWANVRGMIGDFLYNEWRNGALLGSKPEEAYFVRCDRTTMTQNDLDNGRLVCLVGVAVVKPAEFVVFRIGQKTADAKS